MGFGSHHKDLQKVTDAEQLYIYYVSKSIPVVRSGSLRGVGIPACRPRSRTVNRPRAGQAGIADEEYR